MKSCLLSIMLVVVSPASLYAQASDRSVVATVVTQHAAHETNTYGDQLIVTHGMLSVFGSGEMLDATWPGGTLNGLTLRVSELPELRVGEQAIFALDARNRAHHIVPVTASGGGGDPFVLGGRSWTFTPVSYYVNPTNLDVADGAAVAAIVRGATAWGAQSQASIALTYAGPTSGSALVNNGKNEVFFRNEANSNVIAMTYSWWDSAHHVLDSDIVFYDGGFTFVTDASSGCSGAMYVEDVATHEFGHVLGLGHTDVATATMYPSIGYCATDARSLDPDDVAGIEAIYPPGDVPPPPAPPPTGYVLTVTTYKQKGYQFVALTWTGSSAVSFDVYRDGTLISTVAATSYTDALRRRGGGSYQYQVCDNGTSTCSNVATAQF